MESLFRQADIEVNREAGRGPMRFRARLAVAIMRHVASWRPFLDDYLSRASRRLFSGP